MTLPQTPLLTTDCVIFNDQGAVLLIRRKHPPFAGSYALPGGFVEIGETVEAACIREVREETGLTIREPKLIGAYSRPGRDPRGHTVSVAFTVKLTKAAEPQAGSDAASASWIVDWQKITLAFDHAEIIAGAVALLGA
jgi:8-oxo-dGTP diphosphatase